jgi:hypothetical protein
MRLHSKVPTQVGPCPLCRRELKLDFRGRPWAHKCSHGEKCDSLRNLGLKDIPVCSQCKADKEKIDG